MRTEFEEIKFKETTRNYLSPGDKVLMKTGEILTVKSLEFRHFVAVERSEYVPKSHIKAVLTCG